MKNPIAAFLCCASAFVLSCTAPNDLDTPRKTTYDPLPSHVKLSTVEISFTPDPMSLPTTYDCVWQQAEIDTTGGLRLWLRGTSTRPAASDTASLLIKKIIMAFDGVDIGAGRVSIIGDDGNTTGTSVVCYSLIQDRDISFIPDGSSAEFTVENVQHDKQSRTITADLTLKLSPDGRQFGTDALCTIRY